MRVRLGECEEARVYALIVECAQFDAMLRRVCNASVGEVALWELGRSLNDHGLRELWCVIMEKVGSAAVLQNWRFFQFLKNGS